MHSIVMLQREDAKTRNLHTIVHSRFVEKTQNAPKNTETGSRLEQIAQIGKIGRLSLGTTFQNWTYLDILG